MNYSPMRGMHEGHDKSVLFEPDNDFLASILPKIVRGKALHRETKLTKLFMLLYHSLLIFMSIQNGPAG